MSDKPLVSVIVPAYNAASYLEDCLASLVAQTYPRLEIVVMDDASTDATPVIAQKYSSRVRLVRQPRNVGQFPNVNAGIALAAGELVAVFHADDAYAPNILEQAVAAFQRHPEARAVFCLDELMDPHGRVYGRVSLPPGIPANCPLPFDIVLNGLLTYRNRFLRTPGTVVRRDAYAAAGPYRADCGTAGDLEMWTRIARLGPIVILDRHLFRYRHTPTSVEHSYQQLRTEPEQFFTLIDNILASGGRQQATAAALRAYEAHRTEDRIIRGIRAYILGDRAVMRAAIRHARVRTLLQSSRVQRSRLIVLLAALRVLGLVPHFPGVAGLFRRRWVRRWA